MANIDVDYDQVRNVSGLLGKGHNDITTQLGQLKAAIGALVGGGGGFTTTSASGAFQQSYENWNKGALQALTGLEGMQNFLNKVVSEHQSLDSGLAQSAGQG